MMANYSLIIPIYNEERTLEKLIKQLEKLDKNIQIILVNDGSNDLTEKILSKHDTFEVVKNKINRGKGYAIRKGLRYSKNENIILFDGDLEIELSSIPNIINEYELNNKIPLTGFRWRKSKYNIFDINRMGNYFINNLFNIIYSSSYNDVLCCVKIIDKKLLEKINLKSNGFSLEVEILAKLTLKKISITETKVTYARRSIKEGKKLKFSDAWSILKMIVNKQNFNVD